MAKDIGLSDNLKIGENEPVFIIAEIGQNHQGDLNIAKQLIKAAKESGANCAKLQKTCLSEKFNRAALDRVYPSEHSWGRTYGDHKRHLEFSDEEFTQLQAYAHEIGVLFTASAMDPVSLRFLVALGVPFVKIGSGDSNNLALIEEAARTNVPLVVSTGMLNIDGVQQIYSTISKYHKNFVLMHCVSAYPTPLEDIHLRVIENYRERFPDVQIGYSGHEIGTDITPAAVAMGAKVIERHITLDCNQKGSDQKCSLEPLDFALVVHKIRELEVALGTRDKSLRKSELPCQLKLGKTLVASKDLRKGQELRASDVRAKVAEPRGMDAIRLQTVIGRRLATDVGFDRPIMEEHLKAAVH